ncbi:beta-galactosidase [Paenibacillus sp. YN15]|uniref:beta-galactosidase n=1 Tax=Paenibacillus sp. YN15 TaxID=1742774 RepID=UPI0015ECA2ED|nr:beta-galactosidase [Paenibacillus sp. YN15]
MKKQIVVDRLPQAANERMAGFGGVHPAWGEFAVNTRHLLKDGEPWMPVMGEFHYSRYPEAQWEESIRKMIAGGITVLSTYVFWIHHEEIRGEFDWSGQRNLRRFIELCGEYRLPMFLRIGPWCHGEVRNGGFPDWLVAEKMVHRSNDPVYMEHVKRFWTEIHSQAKGLLFKDGGPVLGIQLENEYGHAGGLNGQPGRAHMLALKELAIRLGLEAPFYTATGWGNGVVVEGETLPVLGGYADAPWTRHVEPLKPSVEYLIRPVFLDSDIGTDLVKPLEPGEYSYDVRTQPYLTAELGGGIQVTGHRRPLLAADDVEALAFTKLASGANLLGYYMYHGGTNPAGKLTTLQESRATGYPNDVPELSYDFQAPIREYGQISAAYRHLKRLGLFAADFGQGLAAADCFFPADSAQSPEDPDALRYSLRIGEDGGGYLFAGNYQRFAPMAAKPGLELAVSLPGGDTLEFPPLELAAQSFLFMPLRMRLGAEVLLLAANVQPLCRIGGSGRPTAYVFFALDGNRPEYWFAREGIVSIGHEGTEASPEDNGWTVCLREGASREITVITTASGETVHVITLSREDAANVWKHRGTGGEHLILCSGAWTQTRQGTARVSTRSSSLDVAVYPSSSVRVIEGGAAELLVSEDSEKAEAASSLEKCPGFASFSLRFPQVQSRVAVREAAGEHVAGGSRVYLLELNSDPLANACIHDCFLRIDFLGERADFFINGEKAADWFYNGETWEIGLKRFAGRLPGAELTVVVYPLRQSDQIYMDAPPRFPADGSPLCALVQAEAAVEYEAGLELRPQ